MRVERGLLGREGGGRPLGGMSGLLRNWGWSGCCPSVWGVRSLLGCRLGGGVSVRVGEAIVDGVRDGRKARAVVRFKYMVFR